MREVREYSIELQEDSKGVAREVNGKSVFKHADLWEPEAKISR